MNKEEIIDVLEYLKRGLINASTYGGYSDKEYIEARKILVNTPELKGHIPEIVKYSRNTGEVRSSMQAKYDHYAERRKYISDVINETITFVEDFEEDRIINNISVLEESSYVGSGGFGEVYRYHHNVLDMDFAMKFFRPVFVSSEEQKEGEKRFFREAKILFDLHHDNIVQVYDAGYISDEPFIRMEFIDGENLYDVVRKHSTFSYEESVPIIMDILKGLYYAHKKGVIHRDLKPSNILFSQKDNKYKIIDFGVSAFLDSENHTKLTKTGEHIAGGSYIDPQLSNSPKLRDIRTDIYSIGAIWFYILTGSEPSGSDIEYRLKMQNGLNDSQIDVVLKCLSYELDDRYVDCRDLANAIKSVK